MEDRQTLVAVGAATRDIHPDDPRGWRLGGTVAYSSLVAARLGLRVRALVGVDDLAATASELDVLREAGVEVELVRLATAPVFDNQQTPTGRVQLVHSTSDPLPLAALPAAWRSPNAVLLGPVAGELSEDWSAAFPQATFVAIAAQGLVRALAVGKPVKAHALRRDALLARADAIAISAEDIIGGAPLVRELLRPHQELLVTHGARGALHIQFDGKRLSSRYMPPLPPRAAVDTTGAGDTFLAAWLATRLLVGGPDWRALAVAAAMASLSVERQSIHDTPTLADLCQVLVRLRDRHLG